MGRASNAVYRLGTGLSSNLVQFSSQRPCFQPSVPKLHLKAASNCWRSGRTWAQPVLGLSAHMGRVQDSAQALGMSAPLVHPSTLAGVSKRRAGASSGTKSPPGWQTPHRVLKMPGVGFKQEKPVVLVLPSAGRGHTKHSPVPVLSSLAQSCPHPRIPTVSSSAAQPQRDPRDTIQHALSPRCCSNFRGSSRVSGFPGQQH